ncbi:MAG: prepilin-type N-terminal cleavage/methylation domain-containing protein [Patescibacteria group bacterium]
MKSTINRRQQGFTIIELMIATCVISVILLMVSVIMINIGNLYYKGISQSRVQGNVRSLTDELAQRLSLSSAPPLRQTSPNGSISRLCIGDTSYTYTIGVQIGTNADQIRHVIWRDTITPGTCDQPSNGYLSTATPSATGTELITARSRLSAFCVGVLSGGVCTPAMASPYPITIRIALGENDILCSPSTASNTCNDQAASLTLSETMAGDLTCKGKQGDSYCATANLTTTVIQRLR